MNNQNIDETYAVTRNRGIILKTDKHTHPNEQSIALEGTWGRMWWPPGEEHPCHPQKSSQPILGKWVK